MRIAASVLLACLTCSGAAFGADGPGVTPAATEKYQKAKEMVSRLAGSRTLLLAPEVSSQASRSVDLAQEGLKAGNDRQTREFADMALLQYSLANALAEEKDAKEKTAAARREYEKFEKRLADILAGKGEQP